MGSFNTDYVEVHERLAKFYERYPDGRLSTVDVRYTSEPDGVPRVMVEAAAYRTPDDPVPGRGWSWMILPGSTNFTRGSELENTETSAWGRAMAAVGIEVKRGIASASEVRNKSGDTPVAPRPAPSSRGGGAALQDGPWEGPVTFGKPPTDGHVRQTPDGTVFGFVITEPVPGRERGQRAEVVAEGQLADALEFAFRTGKPETAMVWGRLEMVPWEKDGKSMPPYRRIRAERVMTPEWTLPATDPAPDSDSGVPDDLPW